MSQLASTLTTTTSYAVISGGNKGIGFEICKQLASNGIVVILTARDENKGLEALKKLKQFGLKDELLFFHQLDVLDPASIAALAHFLKTNFGKLDILVNNAGISGVDEVDHGKFNRAVELRRGLPDIKQVEWNEISKETLESAENCLKTNYYGAKRTVEALAPLLHLSDSARIVNVSSIWGSLEV
ncbi:NAD(P)-binding Rossmann-fold superfamily protein [Euphorbia peplus]|nr:NAD(P)-binding Rossmann-fold superfamily protein [Euphorbia peplus]